MSDSSLAGLASLLTMFERLQQPITFKLPHRGGRRKGAAELENGSVVDETVDPAHNLDGVSGAEATLSEGDETATGAVTAPFVEESPVPRGDVFVDAGNAELQGEQHQPLAVPARPFGSPSDDESAEGRQASHAEPPSSAFADAPYSDALAGEEPSASDGGVLGPHSDAPNADAFAAEAAPAVQGDPLGASALTTSHLMPVAAANLEGPRVDPESASDHPRDAAEQASVADEADGEVAPARAPARRMRSIRPRRASMPRRSSAGRLVGLDIEPGQVVAVQAHVNGEVVVERAAGVPLAPDVIRDGEVNDPEALREALRSLFAQSKLDRRVRIGIANQRIVMRRIELPPITDAKEIASAVRFQAADEIPMPLDSVVLDYHSLGIVETAAGPRLHVVLVAARRDMVQRVLDAARGAGLRPEGVDLAAFAMIRALRRGARESTEQVLYLSIGGITNLAIASGATCEFTRAIGTGIEQIVAEVASRCGIALGDARRLLSHVAEVDAATSLVVVQPRPFGAVDASTTADHESTARIVLSDGVRRIAGEVRHSLDFHVSSGRGHGVARAVLCGPALDVPGFATILGTELGMPVTPGNVALASPDVAEQVPASRLAVAAGLAVEDGPA